MSNPQRIDLEMKAEANDGGAGPCVFCGQPIEHVNEGGVGCVAGAIVGGEKRYYAYCNQPVCDERRRLQDAGAGITTCSCEGPGAYDVIEGYDCPACGSPPCEDVWDKEGNRRRKILLVVTVECEYDPDRFDPTIQDPGPDRCNLIDVACFADKLEQCRDHDPPYRLRDATVYTAEDFLLDVRDGNIPGISLPEDVDKEDTTP